MRYSIKDHVVEGLGACAPVGAGADESASLRLIKTGRLPICKRPPHDLARSGDADRGPADQGQADQQVARLAHFRERHGPHSPRGMPACHFQQVIHIEWLIRT